MDTDVNAEPDMPEGEDFVLKDPCSSSSSDNSSDGEFTEESDDEGGIVLIPRRSREQHERVSPRLSQFAFEVCLILKT